MTTNVIDFAAVRRRVRRPAEWLLEMLDADSPSAEWAQLDALFACFGIHVDPNMPRDRVVDIWELITGRIGRHVTLLARTPDVFYRCVGRNEPEYARYLEAVLCGDWKIVRRLAAELRIFETVRPPA